MFKSIHFKLLVVVIFGLSSTLIFNKPLTTIGIVLIVIFTTILLSISFMIWRQPQDTSIDTFKVCLVAV